MCFVTNLDENLWIILFFVSNVIIFKSKNKNMGSLGDKFEIFDQKLTKIWGLWVTEQNFKGSLGEEWAEKGVF